MGCATTRAEERLLAAVGLLRQAPVEFEPAVDVPLGGVLWALPALLAEGLLRHSRKRFALPPGFYPLETIFLVLAFMALVRLRSLEALRYEPPGEWGQLVGLDRIPEVRTLRQKLGQLCQPPGVATTWSSELAREWMAAQSDHDGVYYADGHVRVYHGKLAALPRRYVARQKLCLRGTTDYWINALDGRPFFLVNRPVDPGLIEVLRTEIVPRLLADAPCQPTEAELAADPLRHRFTMVFDRAGYSPEFFVDQKAQRVAILTYHKFPGQDWAAEEFAPHELTLANGEKVTLSLAERGTCLSNGLWVREIRQREESGHQVSMLSTDYRSDLRPQAVRLFARWTQENFLKYMREHYAIDRLVEHGTEPLPETTTVVNPAWRKLDRQIRREQTLLQRDQAAFGALTLSALPEPPELDAWQQQKARLHEAFTTRQTRLVELKAKRKETPRHLALQDLPKEEQFPRLRAERKHFVDTLKLIAYRAETALVGTVREALARHDDGRALVRELMRTPADLHPDPQARTLTVCLHPLPSRLQDAAVRHLAEELTATETTFPGTDLRLVFTLNGPT
ncbi:MAG: putative transposase [Phycisphaerales bacterium]